jgi:hypothetical protein
VTITAVGCVPGGIVNPVAPAALPAVVDACHNARLMVATVAASRSPAPTLVNADRPRRAADVGGRR